MPDNSFILQQPNDSRILYLNGDVEDTNISQVCKDLLNIIEEDKKGLEKFRDYKLLPIKLYVQSYGGSINDMWALIDIIESSTTPIITYCSGYCMSAAALIFLAGHYRCMYKHSSIMFHQMFVATFGKIMDFNLEQKQFDNMHRDMIKYIKKHTKLTKKFFHKMVDMKRDMYLDAKQCLKHGVCDSIIDNSDIRSDIKKQLTIILNQQECGGLEDE